MQPRSRPRARSAGVTPTPLDRLRAAVLDAVAGAQRESARGAAGEAAGGGGRDAAGADAAVTLKRPPRAELGDYSTNAALLLAPRVGAPPRDVAQGLADRLRQRLGEELERADVAGPGFLNLFLADAWHARAPAHALVWSEPGA